MTLKSSLILALSCLPTLLMADPPSVEMVKVRPGPTGWTFDVTLSHPDTGWDHYADGWRVLDMDGNELGMRVLYHPHVDEQPFTRSLGNVVIPQETQQVQIQARCNVDGWADELTVVNLPR